MYWEWMAGESGDESDIVEKLEGMLPVDDLRGASRAIAHPTSSVAPSGRWPSPS